MNDILLKLYIIPGILLGFTIHEFSHAIVAYRLGDDTPKHQGRLTLSPFAHIDLMGFLAILLIGFGWAKPVQINTGKFKNPRRDHILVSLAGPLSNLALAIISLLIYKFASPFASGQLGQVFMTLLLYCIIYNFILFVFNLIPIPPLDGYSIFKNLAPLSFYPFFSRIEKYTSWILLIFVIFFANIIIIPITKLIFPILFLIAK